MVHPDPLTAEKYRQIHNIGDPATLARLVAEHPNNPPDGDPDDPTTDPDCVPNPPYDLPSGVTSWSEWCR
ncbi:hypothetical protein [Streptomyces violaceusniger]|uniref:hypothetical protein n=1 Tax=Streptomyces violaceusniger TaxID=68280 RepID=UPI0036A840EC